MPEYDLCSAVFVLRPQRMFSTHYRFLGRMAQKLFLLMLTQAGYASLAEELHDLVVALPFTVSDLFQDGSDHYWMRVTGLNLSICQVIQHMSTILPGQTFDVPPRDSADESKWTVGVEAVVTSQHEWAGQSTYEGLVNAAWKRPRGGQLTLDFMTPTVLKSVGVYRLFPEPALVFRLLYERLLKMLAIRLPFQPEITYLETFAEYCVETTDFQMSCAHVPLKHGQAAAFYGLVTYRILAANPNFYKRAKNRQAKHNDFSLMTIYRDTQRQWQQYACLFNLLAAFAFYSGLGMYTGQGMGMVRKVELYGR